MIDLHVHTNFSDGTDSYIEVLKKAQNKGIEILSITDHDNCYAYDELKKINIKDYYDGIFITGVELKTKVGTLPIELLGYGVDTDIINKEVKKIYPTFEKKNQYELKSLCNTCKKLEIDLGENPLQEYDSNKWKYATDYIYEKIAKNSGNIRFCSHEDSFENANRFYRREVCNENSRFYVDTEKLLPSISEVIDLIKKAHGLVFVPHIYVYKENSEKVFNHIIKNYKVDGFECYYSRFTEEQTKKILEYCRLNNLYISGGSDYHGTYKPDIDLGVGTGNLNIKKDIVMPWINKVI